MRSTTFLTTLFLFAIHSSSAGLLRNLHKHLSYLECTDADYTSAFEMVNINPFRSAHIACEEQKGAVMKHHCTFGGKEEDLPDDFVEKCKAIHGKVAYVTYDYKGVCGPNTLVTGDKLPICVPNKCLEDDWVPIFIQKKKTQNKQIVNGVCKVQARSQPPSAYDFGYGNYSA